jgi:hypothetical protein
MHIPHKFNTSGRLALAAMLGQKRPEGDPLSSRLTRS